MQRGSQERGERKGSEKFKHQTVTRTGIQVLLEKAPEVRRDYKETLHIMWEKRQS